MNKFSTIVGKCLSGCSMNKWIVFALFMLFGLNNVCAKQSCYSLMEKTWREFRAIHPFGFQTVGLKHYGDTCVFVISEPSEQVKGEELETLFSEYDGHLIIGRKSFGYDGGLYDAIGCAKLDSSSFINLEKRLFVLLYGTNYKPYYTNLDDPFEHVYYSNTNLDFFIPISSWYKWEKEEKFIVPSKADQSLEQLSSKDIYKSNELFYSKKRGFILWIIDPITIFHSDTLFRSNARKFALDTDLIVHTIYRDNKLIIVGREREVPVTILPPLRCETICSIILNGRKRMSVIIKPDSLINITDSVNSDSVYWATPIMMSKLLWNTEMGNLMLLTDFMLKSWSENAIIKDLFIDYPQPPSFFTSNGVAHELKYEPKYFWEFLYGGRTSSLFPSYKNMNDSLSGKAHNLSFKAYDYFAKLNNTDLVRINQYVQISRAFLLYPYLSSTKELSAQKSSELWIQSPLMTVSNQPWGYGGYILQVPVGGTVVRSLMSRGIKTPPNFYERIKIPRNNKLLQIETKAWERLQLAEALQKNNTPTAIQNYKKAKMAYEKARRNLNKMLQHASFSAIQSARTTSSKYEPRATLISPSLGYSDRGFIQEKHNILPQSNQSNKIGTYDESEKNKTSSSWKERLREKVFEKSHKINTIETKGNIYMIYGYIININDDGEYCINYAA